MQVVVVADAEVRVAMENLREEQIVIIQLDQIACITDIHKGVVLRMIQPCYMALRVKSLVNVPKQIKLTSSCKIVIIWQSPHLSYAVVLFVFTSVFVTLILFVALVERLL